MTNSVRHIQVDDDLSAKLARLNELEAQFSAALQRAKLTALKEFAYGASHEINNPLANISTRAQALLADERHPERKKKLATIVAQAMRAHEMISDLMLFAKPPPVMRSEFIASELVQTVLSEAKDEAANQHTEIDFHDEAPDLKLFADKTQLGVALKALLRNALDAVGQGGNIHIASGLKDDQWILCVRDDGPGLSDHIREHLFDPFFSGREAGRGLGFGLCKCWRIAELHGGLVEVESTLGEGATFRLILPVVAAGAAD